MFDQPKLLFSLFSIVTLFTAALCSKPAEAETVSWQGYEIHYTTFRSTLIPKEVAAAHNINRSDRRIVANISIRQDGKAVAGLIQGTASNLLSQLFSLDFAEVKEPGAIYYLSNMIVDEIDTLRFELHIQPDGSTEVMVLKFTRKYF